MRGANVVLQSSLQVVYLKDQSDVGVVHSTCTDIRGEHGEPGTLPELRRHLCPAAMGADTSNTQPTV